MRAPLPILLGLLLATSGAPLAAQVIQGRVVDAASSQGVAEAVVTAIGPNQRPVERVRTGADGTFVIRLRAPGAYQLQGERVGYRPTRSGALEVEVRQTVDVVINLSAEPLTIEALRVTGRRQPPKSPALENHGFYRREAAGFGEFLRREDIERYPNQNIAQVLDRVPGTRLHVDRRGRQQISFARAQTAGTISRAQRGDTGPCLPKVYINGLRLAYGPGMDINDVVNPEQVEAVELYRSPSETPQEFNDSDAACGVIAIWTRTGR